MRRDAWRLAELIFGIFSFWQLGCPKGQDEYSRLGAYQVSVAQHAAFVDLYEELLPLCRARPSLSDCPGRGASRILDMMAAFVLLRDGASLDPAVLAGTTAMPVDISGMSVPKEAGTSNPVDLLEEPYRSHFLSDRLAPGAGDFDPVDYPVGCYMVSPEDEPALRKQFLETGTA